MQLKYANRHKGFQELYLALSKSSSDISARTKAGLREKHREIYTEFRKQVNNAIEAKEIKNLSADLLVQVLINATSAPVKSKKNPGQTADEILRIFWSGIARRN